MSNLIKNNRRIFINSDGYLTAAIAILQNNVYKITYYEIISGASGTLTLPTGSTINAGEFSGANCVLSEIDGSNKPTFVTPLTGGGSPVTATLNTGTGAWLKSGVTASTNVALIYSVNITAADYQNLTNFYIIDNVLLSNFSQVLNNSALNSTTSAQLAGVISDETGSGALVFGTSPSFTTKITTPLINGTSGTLQIGTTDLVNIGNATTTSQRLVRIGQDTAWIDIGSQSGSTARGAIYINQATPDTTNYALSAHQTAGQTYLNGKNGVNFLANGGIIATWIASQAAFLVQPANGNTINYQFTVPNNTALTASTEVPIFKIIGGNNTWNTGAIINQKWSWITANTANFSAASIITNSYGLYVEPTTAGTFATITNNYAAGFSGRVGQYGLGNSTYFGDLCGVKDDIANRQNTAFGAQAANKVASGGLNIAMGYQSLFTNVSGNNNVAIGGFTLLQATSNSNIAVGGYALYNLTTGQSNVALGYDTGGGVTIGANNVFIGNGITGLPSSLSNNIILATNLGVERFRYNPSQGSASLFSFSPASTTANVASTEINIFRVNTATTTILTGALTTQRFTYLPSQTLAFAAASTATNVYGLFVEAATAGTNATITNNYAAGFDGDVRIVGNGVGTTNPLRIQGYVSAPASLTAFYTAATPSATNYNIVFDPTYTIVGGTVGSYFRVNNVTTMQVLNTGIKIGLTTSQTIGFWNATPIVQPTTAVAAATVVSGAGGNVKHDDTFDGYTVEKVVRALRNIGLLA